MRVIDVSVIHGPDGGVHKGKVSAGDLVLVGGQIRLMTERGGGDAGGDRRYPGPVNGSPSVS
jgi:hypothetical protein